MRSLVCPVCRQEIITNVGGRNIDRHPDTAGNEWCPGSGLAIQICREAL